MNNMDSITPQEFAKQMGAYPNAPYNPIPVGGYMDEGFDWVLGAESEQGTMIQVGIGSPSGSTKEWTRIFTVNAPYSNEELAEYVMPSMKIDLHTDAKEYFWREDGDSKSTIVNITMGSPSGQTTGGWNIDEDLMAYGDEEDIESFTLNLMTMIKNNLAVRYDNKDPIQQVMFSKNWDEMNRQADLAESKFDADSKDKKYCIGCGTPSGYPHPLEKLPYQVGLDGTQAYSCRDCFDEVREAESFEASGKRKMCADCKDAEGHGCGCGGKSAESYSQVMGPTIEANEGGLHSPSSFNITWEDGTGQSSASMPPNEIHFGADSDYDFQKMTPSAYTPFDQIGNELQQQRMESGPMLEPTNANYSAEAMPISDDGELLAVYDDMGTNKGFIEMEDDLEDDSIEIEISDDEMNEIAEVRLDSEVVGNPSPSSPLEEVPATVPSPAEPSNQNFSAEKKTDYVTMILGTAALVVGSGMLAKSQGWIGKEAKAADTDDLPSIDPTVNDGLVASPSTGDLLPADYEEMVVESTGYAVPIIPVSLDGSFMGSRFQALPTDRLVESNEPGIGAHTDVAMYRDTMYREPEQSMVQAPSLNAEHEYSIIDKIMAFFKGKKSEEKEVKESQGVGQAPYFGYGFERKNPQLRVVKETGPIGLDPSTAPYLPQNLSGYTGQAYRPPTIYGDMMGLGVAGASVPFVNPNTATVGANRFGSNPVDSSTLQSIHGNLSSSTNASYTNGSKTMSLAQWSIDYDVSQISDSEAVAVSRSSGIRTMIRRV